MKLEPEELVKIDLLIKRSSSRWRKWGSIFLMVFLIILFLMILAGSLLQLWEIRWKELWWLGLIFLAFSVACKVVYDLEKDLEVVLGIIKRFFPEESER
jgi:TRAP-type C4-dicarboxylate transport system permease small subunit